ncbi:MAG TPA: hypothetical protein VK821_12525 [Dehalococcoidia bacterium]|nr:hypothetical protein [Dehalococcoidia bacterium]
MKMLRMATVVGSLAIVAGMPGLPASAASPSGLPGAGVGAEAVRVSGTSAPSSEDSLAASLLLTAADFPAGWQGLPSSPGQTSVLQLCSVDVPGRTGLGRGTTFSPDAGARAAAETVSVFDNQSDAAQSVSLLQGVLDCTVSALEGSIVSGARVTEASYEGESLPGFGDRTRAYRLHLAMQSEQLTSTLDEYIDFVYVIDGRVGFSIQASGLSVPFDTALLLSIVTQAGLKVQNMGVHTRQVPIGGTSPGGTDWRISTVWPATRAM